MYEKNEQKIKISKVFWGRLHRASKILEVSMQSLTSFLICNSYDDFMLPASHADGKIEKALKEYAADARKNQDFTDMRNGSNRILTIRLSEYLLICIDNLCGKKYFRQEKIIALLWEGMKIISTVLDGYSDIFKIDLGKINPERAPKNVRLYSFDTEKRAILGCIGINRSDFSRIAEAVALYAIIENTSHEIRNSWEYINFLKNQKDVLSKRKGQTNKKKSVL